MGGRKKCLYFKQKTTLNFCWLLESALSTLKAAEPFHSRFLIFWPCTLMLSLSANSLVFPLLLPYLSKVYYYFLLIFPRQFLSVPSIDALFLYMTFQIVLPFSFALSSSVPGKVISCTVRVYEFNESKFEQFQTFNGVFLQFLFSRNW